MKTTREEFCRNQKSCYGKKLILCHNVQGFWLMRFHKGENFIKEKKKTIDKSEKSQKDNRMLAKKYNNSNESHRKIEKIRDLISGDGESTTQKRKKISQYYFQPSFPKIEKKKKDDSGFRSIKLHSNNESQMQTSLKKKEKKKKSQTTNEGNPRFAKSDQSIEKNVQLPNRIKNFRFQEMNTIEPEKRTNKYSNQKKTNPLPRNQSQSSPNSPEKLNFQNPLLQTVKLYPEHKISTGVNFFPKKHHKPKKVQEQKFIRSIELVRNTVVDAWQPKQDEDFDSLDDLI